MSEYFTKNHQRKISKAIAAQVASFVKESRYLFVSAHQAPLESKPLLLYYGQLNLAKATILLTTSDPPTSRHGLSSANKKITDSMIRWDCQFYKPGIATEFAAALGFPVTVGAKFTLWDLLRRDPSCSTVISAAFGPKRLAFVSGEPTVVQIRYTEGGRVSYGGSQVGIDSKIYAESELRDCFKQIDGGGGSHWIHVRRSRCPLYGYETPSGLYGVISIALPGQKEWCPLVVRQLATGFILSEIARYRPDLIAFPSARNERLIPVIDVAMRQIERTFPNECLNHILKKRVYLGFAGNG